MSGSERGLFSSLRHSHNLATLYVPLGGCSKTREVATGVTVFLVNFTSQYISISAYVLYLHKSFLPESFNVLQPSQLPSSLTSFISRKWPRRRGDSKLASHEVVFHPFSVAMPGLVALLAGHFFYSFTGGVHQNH